jgi:hypothetical protein
MVNAILYLEGGGDSKELHTRCREGFRRLLEACGFSGRMPRLVACGGRSSAFDDFTAAHRAKNATFVGLWIDSEDYPEDGERTWVHLKVRDGWEKPEGAQDDQVFLMTVCMETWIVADRKALREQYGRQLQESGLPPLSDLEQRPRHDIQDKLVHATRNCVGPYAKGRRSFEVLARLTPETLERLLPSFARARRILGGKLSGKKT